MYAGAMHTWGWFKQLTRMEEQKFTKITELPLDVTVQEDNRKSRDVRWSFSDLMFVTTCIQIDLIYICDMGFIFDNDRSAFISIKVQQNNFRLHTLTEPKEKTFLDHFILLHIYTPPSKFSFLILQSSAASRSIPLTQYFLKQILVFYKL